MTMPILKKYDNFEAMKRDEVRSNDRMKQERLYEEFKIFLKFLQAQNVKKIPSEPKYGSSSDE